MVQGHFVFPRFSAFASVVTDISKHRIIFVSTCFSTFASLVRVISRHRIIFVFPRFSTFTSFVRAICKHRIIFVFPHFSTFANLVRASSRNRIILSSLLDFPEFGTARAFLYHSTLGSLAQGLRQERRTTSSSSAGLLRPLLVSAGIKIFLSLYNFPDAHTILIVTTPVYMLRIDTPLVKQATHTTYMTLPLRKQRPLFFRKQV